MILLIDVYKRQALGLVHLMEQAKAEVVGLGMVIEKSFQDGRQKLLDQGMKLTSLARIEKFEDGKVCLLYTSVRLILGLILSLSFIE